MSLHVDIPTPAQIERLLSVQGPWCASVYLATDPVSRGEAERIELKNAVHDVRTALEAAGAGTHDVAALVEPLEDLEHDGEFWRFQARTLAVFATPERHRTFRLPNHLTPITSVADRFHVKPLLRAVTFPQAALVLALAQNSVRLVEITADTPPEELRIPDMPTDAASAVGKSSIADRGPVRRLQGSEGQKVRLTQYARQIDHALRPVLNGLDLPLILAATQPLDAIFRSVCSSPSLVEPAIHTNPETLSDEDLATQARAVLDRVYADQLADLGELFETRTSQGRAATDLADVARAATLGAVQTALIDIDAVVPGVVDEDTGEITIETGPPAYGVVDEIARRILTHGGRVLGVRADQIPGGGPAAAILRWAPS
jgi:hypothetical protein